MRTIRTENSRNSKSEANGKKPSGKKITKIWVYLARLSSVQEIFENAVPFAAGSCRKFRLQVWVEWKAPIILFPFQPERPKFSVPFVWIICSAGNLLGEREILQVFCKLYKSIPFLFSVRKAMVVYCLEHSIRKNSTTFSNVPFLPEIFQNKCYIYFPMGLSGNFLKNGKQLMSVSFAGKFSPKFPFKW